MPATTPTYAIPYPLATDKLADGAAAIQATAEAVDRELGETQAAVNAQLAAQDAEHAAALGYRRLFLSTGGL